jgi:phage gp46-like protein
VGYEPANLAAGPGLFVERASTNYALQSSDFTAAAWTKIAVTVTPGTDIAPDGTLGMSTLTGTAATTSYVQQAINGLAAGSPYTASVFLRQGSAASNVVRLYDPSVSVFQAGVVVNWIGGAPVLTSATGWTVAPVMKPTAQPGLYRLEGGVNTGALTGLAFLIYPSASNAAESVKAWGVDLEPGTSATSYIPTTAAAATRGAELIGFSDYSYTQQGVVTLDRQPVYLSAPAAFGTGDGVKTSFPVAPPPGTLAAAGDVAAVYRNDWQGAQLLYTTPRTNTARSSQSIDNAIWTKSGTTVSADVLLAPDASLTADKAVEDGTTAVHGVFETVHVSSPNYVAGNVYTSSIFARAGERQAVQINVAGYTEANFNLLTGAITSVTTGNANFVNYSAAMQDMGNGWYRCSVTRLCILGIATTSMRFYLLPTATYSAITAPSYAGDGASGLYLWGAQYEHGLLSSYIATGSNAVTVTDYAVDGAGNAVLAAAPALNARLTWLGRYTLPAPPPGAVLSWTGSYVLNTITPGGDLQTGDDLITAVLISLFTDRIANEDDEIPDGTDDPRGWWADAGERYPIGSRLWLLSREKQTNDTAMRARDYIVESLQWLIDDGVVARFDVDVAWVAPSSLGAQVVANRVDGTTVAMNFASVWQGIN